MEITFAELDELETIKSFMEIMGALGPGETINSASIGVVASDCCGRITKVISNIQARGNKTNA